MDKRGFTLIELLIVIALLSVIGTIITISISKIQNNTKKSECNRVVTQIEVAAEACVEMGTCSKNNITVGDLISNNLLKSDIIINNQKISELTNEVIIYNASNNEYTFNYECEEE